MLDLLTFIIVIVVIFSAVLENIRLKNKNTELMFLLTQSYIDFNAIKNNINNNDSDVEKDHLITFLNDTRDIAFNEIEKLQKGLKEFIDLADKKFAYFDKYGMLSQDQLFYETMLTMSAEYKKLKLLLPKEDSDGR